MNFGIIENNYGKQKIPNYEQWLRNMQGHMENRGAKLTINEDGSATLIMQGKTATQSKETLIKLYEADVKKWQAQGFDF